MPLPTCQCNGGLPIQQQLANIYCALFTFTAGQALSFPLSPTLGGTGVANAAGETITINGGFGLQLTLTGATNVTLPTSGTLLSTAAVVTVAQGGTGVAQLQSFSVNKGGTSQTGIASGFTPVLVTFSTEDWDIGGTFASNKDTPTVAGKYTYNATVTWANPGNNTLYIRKNGANFFRLYTGIGDYGGGGEVILDMNGTTDFVELYVTQQSGAPNDITGIATDTYWQKKCSPTT